MYFGLTNSPATFQIMMNDLFQDLINQGNTATFINNILIATDTEEEHDELVEKVLGKLEENDLVVKPEKCKWKVREVEFLEVVIGPKGVEMQKEKVDEILNWSVHRNIKEVQKFLGLANYYRQFIKNFSSSITCVSKKRAKVEVGIGAKRGIWKAKRNIHYGTHSSNPRY